MDDCCVAHSVTAGRLTLVCHPCVLVGTTWNVWTLLSRRYQWTSGSVPNVLPLELLPPLVMFPSQAGRAEGGGGLLVLWENLEGSPTGQPKLQGDAPCLPLSPPARMGAWQPHISPRFSFFPDAGPVSEEEVSLILADVVPTTSRLRPHVGRTRAIARTRQSERVRATVNRNRISTARRIQVGAHDAVAARLLLVQPLWVLPAPVLVHLGCPNALAQSICGGHSGGVRMAGWGL